MPQQQSQLLGRTIAGMRLTFTMLITGPYEQSPGLAVFEALGVTAFLLQGWV